VATPTFVEHQEVSSWTTTTSPKTATIVLGQAGDRITYFAATADTAPLVAPTNATMCFVEVKGSAGAASPPANEQRIDFEPVRFGPF
jgi:hypothetical protein